MKQRTLLISSGVCLVILSLLALALFIRNNRTNDNEPFQRESSSEFTLADVAKHNSPNDCWVSYGGQVFSITRYLAGLETTKASELSKFCGTNIDTLPTSVNPKDGLSDYAIGLLAP